MCVEPHIEDADGQPLLPLTATDVHALRCDMPFKALPENGLVGNISGIGARDEGALGRGRGEDSRGEGGCRHCCTLFVLVLVAELNTNDVQTHPRPRHPQPNMYPRHSTPALNPLPSPPSPPPQKAKTKYITPTSSPQAPAELSTGPPMASSYLSFPP